MVSRSLQRLLNPARTSARFLYSSEPSYVDGETVLHIGGEHALVGLVDLLDSAPAAQAMAVVATIAVNVPVMFDSLLSGRGQVDACRPRRDVGQRSTRFWRLPGSGRPAPRCRRRSFDLLQVTRCELPRRAESPSRRCSLVVPGIGTILAFAPAARRGRSGPVAATLPGGALDRAGRRGAGSPSALRRRSVGRCCGNRCCRRSSRSRSCPSGSPCPAG